MDEAPLDSGPSEPISLPTRRLRSRLLIDA
jgi:hypothetical protein